MNEFSSDENRNREIWNREQSLRELLKKSYQRGFETGFASGFEQGLKELEKMYNDGTSGCTGAPYSNTPRVVLEAEQILREKSND